MRRGLLTTRETTLDDARVSGVSIGEPLGLRLAGGARLAAIVTGLDKKQQGSSVLVPPAPRREVDRVAVEVLGVPGPGDRAAGQPRPAGAAPALDAGDAAGRSRRDGGTGRGVRRVLVVRERRAASLSPSAPVLAHDRWRGLGHALLDGHLVARSGSLDRRREALHTPSVIGWNLRATWFQRRAGLTDLVATTAGGRQQVEVIDLDEASATALAASATPGLLDQFLA